MYVLKTPWGAPGPYEQSVLNTPIVETNFKSEEDFKGIDILRSLRSFDPCMPCTTHTMIKDTDTYQLEKLQRVLVE